MALSAELKFRVAVGGLGAIGGEVAARLDQGIPGLRLTAVAARDMDKAQRRMAAFREAVPVVSLGELAVNADVVVGCVPAGKFAEVAQPAVRAGRIFMPVSVGALLDNPELIDLAMETGARIIVPTGALLGLDAVRAAAVGEISSVKMVTRKPPAALAGSPTWRTTASRWKASPGLSRCLRAAPGTGPRDSPLM